MRGATRFPPLLRHAHRESILTLISNIEVHLTSYWRRTYSSGGNVHYERFGFAGSYGAVAGSLSGYVYGECFDMPPGLRRCTGGGKYTI